MATWEFKKIILQKILILISPRLFKKEPNLSHGFNTLICYRQALYKTHVIKAGIVKKLYQFDSKSNS